MYHAAGLCAALKHIQNAIAPEYPADEEPPQCKWQDDGRCGCIGQGDHVDEHARSPQLTAHADVEVREPCLHLGTLPPAE